jgi:hypothetical protein
MSYQAQQMQTQGLIWVDGEAAAKAYQMPPGWPANTPIALWDSNETTIYLKSTNQMGMPNPLQIAHYELIDKKGMSGAGEERGKAWDEEMKALYASKEELTKLREEVEKLKGGKKE